MARGGVNRRYAPYLIGLLVSGMMCFLVTGIATYRAIGLPPDFVSRWIVGAWLPSWVVAYPTMLVASPIVRRFVDGLVRD